MSAELIIGIITLIVALLALIATIVVPIVIYKQQKKEERQKMQDEYDALQSTLRFPMTPEQRKINAKKWALEKGLKRK